MERDKSDGGLVHRFFEMVKRAFGGTEYDEARLKNTDLAAQARGEGAGDTSHAEADASVFHTDPDPSVPSGKVDRAETGADTLATEGSDDETLGISTEPSLGEGDAGAVNAPVSEE
jgi:hypothetical protein